MWVCSVGSNPTKPKNNIVGGLRMKLVFNKKGITYVIHNNSLNVDVHKVILYNELNKFDTVMTVRGIKPVVVDGVFTGIELEVDSFKNIKIIEHTGGKEIELPTITCVSTHHNVRKLLEGTHIRFMIKGVIYTTRIKAGSEITSLNQLIIYVVGSTNWIASIYKNYNVQFEGEGEWVPIRMLKMKE